jgi:hypothetical protein
MTQFAFWNSWQKPYRILFLVLLVLLAGSILYFVISIFFGSDFVIEWVLRPTLEAVQVRLPAWQHPLQNIQIALDTYVVKQTYWGSSLQVNTTAAAISLLFFLLSLAVMLAGITTLSRLWYLVGITAFCGVIVLLRLEQLGVLGRFDTTATAAVFVLVLPLTYYFHAVRTHSSFLLRLGAFAGLLALLALGLGLLATVPYPHLYVVNYGMPAWLGLSFILLLLIGPEIIAGILYLITASANSESRGSFRHFMLASGLYLLNLFLYYLQERQYLDWDIYLIGPFWILIISLITGLWTLRLRRETLSAALVVEPYGLMLYVSLAMLTLSTLAYAAATDNNPLLETFEDAILYTHMGMGLALVIYIVANFYSLLRQNQRVYKVLYRPQYMPLFTARFAGLIIVLAFYVMRGNFALFQTMAGYYNGIGDLYAVQGDLIVSQNYYRLGSQYQIRNHRSNYALASLAIEANQPKPAMLYLQEAAVRQPTPYTYANLANLYREGGQFFDALFTLRQGVQRFPLSGPLYNNLGLSYGTTQLADSAFYFLRAAAADSESQDVALANMLAVLSQQAINISPDSLLSWDLHDDLALKTNFMALANRQGYRLGNLPAPLAMVSRDSGAIAPLYMLNYALQAERADSALVNWVGARYEQARLSVFEEQWGMAYALLLYKQANHFGAFAAMQDLSDRSQFNNVTYYKILGQWALEQRAPALAAEWFEQAHMRGDPMAGYYRALALAESGQAEEASQLWVSLPDTTLPVSWQQRKTMALLALSNSSLEDVPQAEELAGIRLRLRAGTLIPAEVNALLGSLTNTTARADALLHLTQQALAEGDRAQAQTYLAQLQALSASLNTHQQQTLLALRIRHKVQTGSQQSGLEASETLVSLQQQAARELSQGNTRAALELLRQVAQASPFEEEAILQAVHLHNAQKQYEEGYALLRRALLLNKYAVPLLEAYALQSLQLGLESYSRDALLTLEAHASPERYRNFLDQYNRLKTSIAPEENW